MLNRRILSLTLALLLLLAGCSAPAKEQPAQAPFYEFTDANGNEVVLAQKPQRVAVLFSSFAEIWTLAGGEVAVTVGESVERGFAKDGTPLVDAGAGKTIDAEQLLACQPDFVIGSADLPGQQEACATARKAGIPAAEFRVESFADYLNVLKICTDLTENPDAYRQYGEEVSRQVEEIRSRVKEVQNGQPPEILFVRAGSTASSTKAKGTADHFAAAMLQELGAVNIADSAPILLDGLSLEEVLQRDPDVIILTTMGDEEAAKANIESLFASGGWSRLTAVAEGKYTFLPKELFHFKPNARWAEAYACLAALLYPEMAQ